MTDAVVIGGGVIGLSIARELSMSGKETIVLEKNERAGDVTSSRNSGVIHAEFTIQKVFKQNFVLRAINSFMNMLKKRKLIIKIWKVHYCFQQK